MPDSETSQSLIVPPSKPKLKKLQLKDGEWIIPLTSLRLKENISCTPTHGATLNVFPKNGRGFILSAGQVSTVVIDETNGALISVRAIFPDPVGSILAPSREIKIDQSDRVLLKTALKERFGLEVHY